MCIPALYQFCEKHRRLCSHLSPLFTALHAAPFVRLHDGVCRHLLARLEAGYPPVHQAATSFTLPFRSPNGMRKGARGKVIQRRPESAPAGTALRQNPKLIKRAHCGYK
jgi:hypothetical protein